MFAMLAGNWWLILIRGIAAILFGILALVWPGLTLAVLVALFAAYAIIDGVSLLWSLVRGDPDARRSAWSVAILGIVGIIAGIVAFVLPGITALSLLYIVAAWAIITGILQVVASVRLRKEMTGELWLAIGGIISIVFGLYLAILPGAGLLSLVWIVGLWAIVFGVTSIVLAWRLRALRSDATMSGSSRRA